MEKGDGASFSLSLVGREATMPALSLSLDGRGSG
jgi:hypothetical protein